MRFTTFYFSGTGNTGWAAAQFEKAAKENGDECRSFSIETPPEDLNTVVEDTDILGLAFPVYAMNIPAIMQAFIERLCTALKSQHSAMPFYVIVTAGYADGCGPYEVLHQFPPRMVRLRGYAGLTIALNLYAPPRSGSLLSPEKMQKRLDVAQKKINKLADALHAGRKSIPPGPYSIVLFRKKMMALNQNMYSELSVCPDTCTNCRLCIQNCPSGAMQLIDGQIQTTQGCTACFRCFNYCPTASIWYKGRYADPSLYPRYTGPDIHQSFLDGQD